jgi:hypothetical protein
MPRRLRHDIHSTLRHSAPRGLGNADDPSLPLTRRASASLRLNYLRLARSSRHRSCVRRKAAPSLSRSMHRFPKRPACWPLSERINDSWGAMYPKAGFQVRQERTIVQRRAALRGRVGSARHRRGRRHRRARGDFAAVCQESAPPSPISLVISSSRTPRRCWVARWAFGASREVSAEFRERVQHPRHVNPATSPARPALRAPCA